MFIAIQRKSDVHGTVKHLPSSKSISNRAILLNALTGNQSVVSNLSTARDTFLMNSLIKSEDKIIDAMDAGTTMRFLTAYFALSGKNKILTGTERMRQRPIALLVEALRKIGASIDYLEKEGFPPIEIKGFGKQQVKEVSLPGDVSSQYISALMMIAPVLPHGLTILIEGPIGSRPYIEMTAALMKNFGASCNFDGSTIEIPAGTYAPSQVMVEADWSAASYWYGFTALSTHGEITLPNVSQQSLQGDRAIVEAMEKLGVKTKFDKGSAILSKITHGNSFEWNFKDCPDLAQTILPVCAASGISGSFTGMESLRIKETDRIAALQNELAKIGSQLTEQSGTWKLSPGKIPSTVSIQTYHDHRMAMGLAPWAALIDLKIEDPDVVNKSYPGFWDDLRHLGFQIE